MIIRRALFIIFIALLANGCIATDSMKIKVAGSTVYSGNENDREVQQWIAGLTSPEFFQYTQAANKLIQMGTAAIPALYHNRHLTREADGIDILVCLQIIEVIFAEASSEWVEAQLQSPEVELQHIAKNEWQKRQKTLAVKEHRG